MELVITCAYCEGDKVLLRFTNARGQTDAQFRAAWKAATEGGPQYALLCSGCGGEYQIVDDGVPLGQDGFVAIQNISKPRLDVVTISGGPRTGGNALYIEGAALELGSLVVKFGGKPALQITNREATRARVVVPSGQYRLNVAEQLSGEFVVGEEVRGLNSGALGAVRDTDGPVIDMPTRAFSSEEVRGTASSARVRLGSPPYSGGVDVSVENEFGQRIAGGAVADGYTYE